ncbi:MAG: DUF4331 domain-containing protein [Deltaproteobacteria bacterium]|nr:DUF4331 domain-containing protein [Deltaproteobacteria bacterium]
MNTQKKLSIALAGLALTSAQPVFASSHREAPLIAEDPAADNTDLYAWVKPGSRDKVYIVANWIPLEEPAGGPNFHKFSDDVRYEIHIARGNQNLNDAVTYTFEFKTSSINYQDPSDLNAPLFGGKEFFSQLTGQSQTYSIWKKVGRAAPVKIAENIKVAPTRIGPRTFTVVQKGNAPQTEYDDAFAASFTHNMGPNEGKVWAGPRDDGFYVDLGGIFDLANLRAKGTAQDGVSGYNTHTIALEVPTTLLSSNGQIPNGVSDANTLGIWASSSRQKIQVLRADGGVEGAGRWIQVSRLGIPLVNEALIGLQDKDKYNRTHPRNDVPNFGAYFLNPVVVRDAEAVGIYAALGVDPTPFKSNRLDIIEIINLKNIPTANAHNIGLNVTGDVLRLDLGVDSGFPNGRPLVGGAQPNQEQADVTDVLLSVILAGGQLAIADGVDYNDKAFLNEFPFLPLPHQGFDEGHGTPTP